MNREQLREQLEHLHTELRQAEALDAHQRELLLTRANDIDQLLERDEIKPRQYAV